MPGEKCVFLDKKEQMVKIRLKYVLKLCRIYQCTVEKINLVVYNDHNYETRGPIYDH